MVPKKKTIPSIPKTILIHHHEIGGCQKPHAPMKQKAMAIAYSIDVIVGSPILLEVYRNIEPFLCQKGEFTLHNFPLTAGRGCFNLFLVVGTLPTSDSSPHPNLRSMCIKKSWFVYADRLSFSTNYPVCKCILQSKEMVMSVLYQYSPKR